MTVERVKHRSTHAVIDSLQLPEPSVVGFLKGEVRAGDVARVWRSQVCPGAEIKQWLCCTLRLHGLSCVKHSASWRRIDHEALRSTRNGRKHVGGLKELHL